MHDVPTRTGQLSNGQVARAQACFHFRSLLNLGWQEQADDKKCLVWGASAEEKANVMQRCHA